MQSGCFISERETLLLLYVCHNIIINSTVAVLVDVHTFDGVFRSEPALLVLQISVNVNIPLTVLFGKLFTSALAAVIFSLVRIFRHSFISSEAAS